MCRSFCLILFMLLDATFALAQTGAVRGRVIDDDDSSVVMGAKVELIHAKRSATILSNDGSYVFDSLYPGFDTLNIKALSYYPITCPLVIKPDTTIIASFVLKITKWYPDSGVCATPVNLYPPPQDYSKTHSKIEYIPKSRQSKSNK